MSLEIHIFINESQVPDRDEWQRAIEQIGFPIELDTTLDVASDTGFSPTTFRGRSTGFEFNLEPSEDILGDYSHIIPIVGNRNMCATFRWGGDLNECGAAMSAAAALAKHSDGVYFYPDDDILYNADEAIDATWNDLNSIP